MPPSIPFSTNRCCSKFLNSSSPTSVFLSRVSQLRHWPCSKEPSQDRTGGGTSSETSQRHLLEERRGAAVKVAVVPQGLAPKGRPDLLCAEVVRLVNVLTGELAVKGFLRLELRGASIPSKFRPSSVGYHLGLPG